MEIGENSFPELFQMEGKAQEVRRSVSQFDAYFIFVYYLFS